MQTKAIIFDVDGTLAHTERDGHLQACNKAFEQMNLPISWSWEHFQVLMKKIQGNAHRLRYELDTKFSLTENEKQSIVAEFEVLKKEVYIHEFLPRVELRDGVVKFIEEAVRKGLKLAIVSTSYESQIHALLAAQLQPFKANFNPVYGKETGPKTGAQGILYAKCVQELGLPPQECVVIEDSEAGLKAALRVGLPTIITYNDYTRDEDFTGALKVIKSLHEIDFNELSKLLTVTNP